MDGAIGTVFVDILRNSGMFTPQEAREMIEIGALNGLFVLGRSLGFIGLLQIQNHNNVLSMMQVIIWINVV